MTFKELRQRAGYTTKHTAKLLGVKLATYQKYECFVRLPNASILACMPIVYKCTGDEVINAYTKAKEVQMKRYGKTNP